MRRELRRRIKSLPKETSQQWPYKEMVELSDVLRAIDQLDEPEADGQLDKLANFIMSEVEGEPSQNQGVVDATIRIIKSYQYQEVLSLEWIDDNSIYASHGGVTDEYVHVDDLQNLIVPKKELPAIPKYMAEYIEWFKNDFEHNFAADIDLIINLIQVSHKFSRREKIKSWISKSGNPQKLIDAYRWGYEVEEEPLYRARLKVVTSEFTASYLRTQSPDAEDRLKALEIGCRPILENYRHLSEFTEDELKRLDIWDNDQWVVEEVEE